MNHKNEFGRRGEDIAVLFYKNMGYRIIDKNYRYKRIGEIDIIVQKDDLVVFVEVKNRNSNRYGGGIYSINKKKIRILKTVARQFINSGYKLSNNTLQFRFDLLSITNGKIEWVEDIIR